MFMYEQCMGSNARAAILFPAVFPAFPLAALTPGSTRRGDRGAMNNERATPSNFEQLCEQLCPFWGLFRQLLRATLGV